ncbi:MAG: 2Fe-2S iron-sulfur cluster-binding protein [Treponema sp.]|nr:2Fe-2S iron-sulfur cluster-binding protein [Treponema sp.]
MRIRFILNGEDVEPDCDPGTRLLDLLRGNFGLTGTKSSCLAGNCGLCLVFFNDKPCPSCLIPAFGLQGGEVITIEAFSLTDEYRDIVAGFEAAGFRDCGFCRPARIIAAGSLVGRNRMPSEEEIVRVADGVKCRCCSPADYVRGIGRAIRLRQGRLREGGR